MWLVEESYSSKVLVLEKSGLRRDLNLRVDSLDED